MALADDKPSDKTQMEGRSLLERESKLTFRTTSDIQDTVQK